MLGDVELNTWSQMATRLHRCPKLLDMAVSTIKIQQTTLEEGQCQGQIPGFAGSIRRADMDMLLMSKRSRKTEPFGYLKAGMGADIRG